jgi:hypothetical protein
MFEIIVSGLVLSPCAAVSERLERDGGERSIIDGKTGTS